MTATPAPPATEPLVDRPKPVTAPTTDPCHPPLTIAIDTREPCPHPWAPFWSPDVRVIRATLETGDIALVGNPDAIVERKTPQDLVACLSYERERFERELRRATHLSNFSVVISGTFEDLLYHRRELHANVVVGSLAAWARRYRIPFFFAGNDELAAAFALRFLTQPVREAERLLKACSRDPVDAVSTTP